MNNIYINEEYIFVAPSKRKNKKYDVYDRNDGHYIVSFGALPYEQYTDRIGYYKKLNHYDKERRRRYYLRHGKYAKKNTAKYFSHKYLW